MTSGSSPLEHRRLRAPQEDRSALIDPPLGEVGAIVAANREDRQRSACDVGGIPWAELARQAREELLAEAVRYTAAYRDVKGVVPPSPTDKVFLAGHQPQLFHAGVWLKNFALGALARQHGAVAVNLVIDSDTMKTHSLRVPGGSAARPQVTPVPLDDPGPAIPFEERRIFSRDVFADFGRRAAQQIAPLVREPIVRRWWPSVVARSARIDNLGTCLAQARHQLEGDFGLNTLEIPQSHVCRTRSFAHYTAFLLAELPRLVEVYNGAVREYRRLHHIRSTAHPFPDLAVDGPWHEAPYWVWSEEDPRRRHLYVRRDPDRLLLSDRERIEVSLPLSPDGDLHAAAERLVELAAGRVRIRSRALVTTLFARLFLGDLFLHGIGGAKYDQVTDALIERFFGLRPPGYLVVSATLHLPIARRRVRAEDVRAVAWRLRELTWHPEKAAQGRVAGGGRRVAGEDEGRGAGQGEGSVAGGGWRVTGQGEGSKLAELIAAKSRWINTPPGSENARIRWLEIRRINGELQPWVADQREQLLREQDQLSRAFAAEKVLAWREYAFCLFPESTLREFLRAILPPAG
jgi:hypothetical protein